MFIILVVYMYKNSFTHDDIINLNNDFIANVHPYIDRFERKPGRWVYKPTEYTLELGRRLTGNIAYLPKKYTYHIGANGGHLSALSSHINHKYFAVIDITDFFGSISATRITRALLNLKLGMKLPRKLQLSTARAIALGSTVINKGSGEFKRALPYGYSQSPMLSSICLDDSYLGRTMDLCSRNKALSISIFMDDIVMSSNDNVLLDLWFDKIKDAAIKSSFKPNEEKEFPVSERVTVFNIHISRGEKYITRERMNQFITEYYDTENDFKRESILRYIGEVNPTQVDDVIEAC